MADNANRAKDNVEKNNVTSSTGADLSGARSFSMDDYKSALAASTDKLTGSAASVLDKTNISLVGGKDVEAASRTNPKEDLPLAKVGTGLDDFKDGAKKAADEAAKSLAAGDSMKKIADQATDAAKKALGEPGKVQDQIGKDDLQKLKDAIDPRDNTQKLKDAIKIDDIAKVDPEAMKQIRDTFKASERMDEKIPSSMSEQDRKTAQDLNWALASGNPEAAARAIERFKGKPEELKKFMDEYNKTLKDSGSGMRATVDGENVTFNNSGNKGVQISTDGRATVRDINHYPNGLVVNGKQDYSSNPSDVMRKMGNDTRDNVNFMDRLRDLIGNPIKPLPIEPNPSFPPLEPNPLPIQPDRKFPHLEPSYPNYPKGFENKK